MILRTAEIEQRPQAVPIAIRRRHRFFTHLDTGFVLLVYLSLVASVPRIFDAMQIQPDEGFELMKGFLCWHGCNLYVDIWNDQPPLHTLLLKWLFLISGPSIQAARGLAVVFGTLFVIAFHVVVKQASGKLAGVIAPLLLLLSPDFLPLSVAVMLEIPAFAVALCSLACAQQFVRRRTRALFVLSAVLAATALQVKLTAGMMFPGLVVVLMQRGSDVPFSNLPRWRDMRLVIYWGISVVSAFLLLSLMLGSGFHDAYRSHFSEGIRQAANNFPDFKFRFKIFEEHPEALLGTAIAFIFLIMRRDVSHMITPLMLASFALLVHWLHFPWWNYYYVHFAIPLCWLAGVALSTAIGTLTGRLAPAWRWRMGEQLFCGVLAAMLCASVWHTGWPRLTLGLYYLKTLHTAASHPLIQKIKEKRDTTTWIFAPNGLAIYGFHAGLPVPPSLAVMPHKRFWSGDITVEQVVTELSRHSPELLLVEFPLTQKPWDQLGKKYTVVMTHGSISLCVLQNQLHESPRPPSSFQTRRGF